MIKYDVIIVSYGEIAIKSSRIRPIMESKLINNIEKMFILNEIYDFEIFKDNAKLIIKCREIEKCIEVLRKVFGLTLISPAVRIGKSIEEIKNTIQNYLNIISQSYKIEKISINVKRSDKLYPYTSFDLTKMLSKYIQETCKNIKVNFKEYDIEINIDIRRSGTYIYHIVIEGFGGLPYGVEGKVISLISGGVDSTIATWLVMKRGCNVIPIHFELFPYYGKDAHERALNALKWLRMWVPKLSWKVYVIPLGKIHNEITGKIDEKYRCLICKVLMYRIAEKIARREKAKAIITGEVIGQVATQTLINMTVLTKLIEIPILRPVLTFDKNEIIEFSKKLNVYDIVVRKVQTCTLLPKIRITKVNEEKLIKQLQDIGIENLIDEALKNCKIIYL